MAPRERRWVAVLAPVAVVVSAMLGTYFVLASIDDLEDGNLVQALGAIARHRNEYRPPRRVAPLGGAHRLRTAAADRGSGSGGARKQVQIDESTERPTTPAGRRYAQHDVDLKLRQSARLCHSCAGSRPGRG